MADEVSNEVAELRAELAALHRRLDGLEQRQALRAAPPGATSAGARSPGPRGAGARRADDDAGGGRSAGGRRNFLALAAGTAAAGATLAATTATPAAAASGDALLLGQVNGVTDLDDTTEIESPSFTHLMTNVFRVANYATSVVLPNATARIAIYGITSGADQGNGLRVGVMGTATPLGSADPRGIGVVGYSNFDTVVAPEPTEPIGVFGATNATTGFGVRGRALSGGGVGVHGTVDEAGSTGVLAEAPATATALRVKGRLRQDTGGAAGPPTGAAVAGEQWRDSTGALFLCTAAGNPGTWRRVTAQHPAFADAGGSINLLARPIRVVDTRPTSTAPLKNGGARLAPSTNTTFQITGTDVGGVSVPAGATGILANITATDTLGAGFFSAFAADLNPPGVSTVNYTTASIANFFVSALSPAGALRVRCGSSAAHCIIDVVGFLF